MINKLIAKIVGSKKSAVNNRLDGYDESNAKIVCQWQAAIESSGNCDYSAMRQTLIYSRQLAANGYKLTAIGLTAKYNDLSQAAIWR